MWLSLSCYFSLSPNLLPTLFPYHGKKSKAKCLPEQAVQKNTTSTQPHARLPQRARDGAAGIPGGPGGSRGCPSLPEHPRTPHRERGPPQPPSRTPHGQVELGSSPHPQKAAGGSDPRPGAPSPRSERPERPAATPAAAPRSPPGHPRFPPGSAVPAPTVHGEGAAGMPAGPGSGLRVQPRRRRPARLGSARLRRPRSLSVSLSLPVPAGPPRPPPAAPVRASRGLWRAAGWVASAPVI